MYRERAAVQGGAARQCKAVQGAGYNGGPGRGPQEGGGGRPAGRRWRRGRGTQNWTAKETAWELLARLLRCPCARSSEPARGCRHPRRPAPAATRPPGTPLVPAPRPPACPWRGPRGGGGRTSSDRLRPRGGCPLFLFRGFEGEERSGWSGQAGLRAAWAWAMAEHRRRRGSAAGQTNLGAGNRPTRSSLGSSTQRR